MRGRLSVGGTTVGGMTRLIVEDRVERPAAEVLHTIVRPEGLSAFFETDRPISWRRPGADARIGPADDDGGTRLTGTEQPMGDGAEGAARRRGADTELVG